ncbi:MAG: hypothetical protein LUC93_00385 [Planctomycetaceae bacterium]|nr:hypothetical protein [Planctomycetaceae bacterium]
MFWALISWQSILAGVITALAISIIMAVLGVALGFTVIKPTSHKPFSGLGTAFGIWSAISVLLSLAAGGFVAGMFSGISGREHGFMVWASALIVAALFSSLAFGSAVRGVNSAMKTVGAGMGSLAHGVGSIAHGVASGVGSVAHSVGPGMSNMAHDAYDHAKASLGERFDIDFDHIDPEKMNNDVKAVLRDTGIETLQPEYLKDQMQAAKAELREAVHHIRLDTDNYDQIINKFLTDQKARLETITSAVDHDAAVAAVAKHRGVSQEEAAKEVDNALKVYHKAVNKTEQAVARAQRQYQATREHIQRMSEKARLRANEMASTAAKSALAAAVALILGAVICVYAGMYGTRFSTRDAVIIEANRGITLPLSRADTIRTLP